MEGPVAWVGPGRMLYSACHTVVDAQHLVRCLAGFSFAP